MIPLDVCDQSFYIVFSANENNIFQKPIRLYLYFLLLLIVSVTGALRALSINYIVKKTVI